MFTVSNLIAELSALNPDTLVRTDWWKILAVTRNDVVGEEKTQLAPQEDHSIVTRAEWLEFLAEAPTKSVALNRALSVEHAHGTAMEQLCCDLEELGFDVSIFPRIETFFPQHQQQLREEEGDVYTLACQHISGDLSWCDSDIDPYMIGAEKHRPKNTRDGSIGGETNQDRHEVRPRDTSLSSTGHQGLASRRIRTGWGSKENRGPRSPTPSSSSSRSNATWSLSPWSLVHSPSPPPTRSHIPHPSSSSSSPPSSSPPSPPVFAHAVWKLIDKLGLDRDTFPDFDKFSALEDVRVYCRVRDGPSYVNARDATIRHITNNDYTGRDHPIYLENALRMLIDVNNDDPWILKEPPRQFCETTRCVTGLLSGMKVQMPNSGNLKQFCQTNHEMIMDHIIDGDYKTGQLLIDKLIDWFSFAETDKASSN